MMKNALLLPIVCLLAFISLSVDTCLGGDDIDSKMAEATLIKVGQQAPDFSCQTLDGRKITLSELRGKVVVLYFFAPRAPYCVTHMKRIQEEVQSKLQKPEDVRILAIGRIYTREELVLLAGDNKLTLQMTADTDEKIYKRFFTKYVPRTVIIGRDGKIATLINGYQEETGIQTLQETIAREAVKPAP